MFQLCTKKDEIPQWSQSLKPHPGFPVTRQKSAWWLEWHKMPAWTQIRPGSGCEFLQQSIKTIFNSQVPRAELILLFPLWPSWGDKLCAADSIFPWPTSGLTDDLPVSGFPKLFRHICDANSSCVCLQLLQAVSEKFTHWQIYSCQPLKKKKLPPPPNYTTLGGQTLQACAKLRKGIAIAHPPPLASSPCCVSSPPPGLLGCACSPDLLSSSRSGKTPVSRVLKQD